MRAGISKLAHRMRRTRVRTADLGALGAAGPGSVIVEPATILCPSRISLGRDVTVMADCYFSLYEEHRGETYEPHLVIGDGTVVGPRVWFSCVGEIEIGREVLIGAGALIADAFHEFTKTGLPILRQPMRRPSRIVIGDGAFLGPGAIVMSGVSVGEGAYVMPGAVAVEDVPAKSVLAGNPGVLIRHWDAESGSYRDTDDPTWAPLLESLDRGV